MVVKLDNGSEEFLAFGCGPPTSCAWDFSDQPADVKSLEYAGDSRAVFASLLRVAGPAVDFGANVFVTKAVNQVVAMQNGFEYLDIPGPGRIEARIPSAANFF